MGLETATYIDDLVPSNPLSTDAVSQGDDHLRLIKTVLQNSFPALDKPLRKWRVEAISDNETVVPDDDGTLYFVTATGGARTVNLPAVSGNAGLLIGVKKADASINAVTIDASGSETIDGALTLVLNVRYDTVWVICDGTAWLIATDARAVPASAAKLVKARLASISSNQDIAGGALQNGTAWDGTTVVTGDIILLTAQTNASQNGLYIAPASGAASRAPGYTTWADLVGTLVMVIEGTNNGDTVWRNKSGVAGTLGTTAITYSQILTVDDFSTVEADLSRDDYLLGINGADGTTKLVDVGDLPGTRMLHVRDQKSNGVDGQSFSTGWNVRDLNNTVHNSITGASLGSNRITLPEGTYDFDIGAPAGFGNNDSTRTFKIALYNVTDSSYTLNGSNVTVDGAAGPGSGGWLPARCRGRVTITATKVFEVRHYTPNGAGVSGGRAAEAGLPEVYTECIVTKVE